jgi:hypothetical protein
MTKEPFMPIIKADKLCIIKKIKMHLSNEKTEES